jgi:6-phosphofructokinase 1
MAKISTIGVYTSGGDAPGMNACIRAVVRTAIAGGAKVVGIRQGYSGMLNSDFANLTTSAVSDIVQRGGTILKTSRCPEFKEPPARLKAAANLKRAGINGLVAIGGDGTARGAYCLTTETGIPLIQAASTIDNDLNGSDFTIGFDTAVNSALQGIDKIRDTAYSHERIFLVEVMGRSAGFIALECAIAGGAEAAFLPETSTNLKGVVEKIKRWQRHGKKSFIFVVAEGDEEGGAFEIAKKLQGLSGLEYKVCILGHIQRGGNPTARDRVLASKLGNAAVSALLSGETAKLVGEKCGEIVLTPLNESYEKRKCIDKRLIELSDTISG